MADAIVTMKFRWVSVSPDPHNKTMRNTLEPLDAFVQVEVPLKHEYIANSEPIIKTQLGVDDDKEPTPILTKEGMRYVIDQLSLEVVAEAISDEEWEDAIDTDDDDNWDSDDEEWEDE
ncbi:MAG: hypothetical protein ACXACR_14675 [Candidatus Hodarchaeales archaeon]|jgi:hypothetical protein